jgi:hypothetical protein
MMPGTTPDVLSDEAAALIYQEMQQGEFDESAVPLSYKVGQLLSTRSVGEIFSVVGLFALIASLYVLRYWMRNAGYNELKPAIKKFGTGKAFGIVLKSLIMDGFLVQSLWKKSKHRWAMHAMIFYGFIGLMVADVLIQVLNPTRSQLEMFDPLKMLPMISGVLVILGISYVFWRYKKDEYIDNGLTLGKDFLFVNLILHAAISGFLVVMVKRGGGGDWLQAVYIYHLVTILLLMVTWPFTRGSHVFVVPFMAAMTRLTEAISVAGVDIGFDREPSPGRHHKSLKIANQVIDECEPGVEGEVKLRYYP